MTPLTFQMYFACAAKEETVKRARGDHPGDISPIVFWERKGTIVGGAQAEHVDRDEGLNLLMAGHRGFASTAMTFISDSHRANTGTNPETGEPWKPGEMQQLCDHGDACKVGMLEDTIFGARYDKVGKTWTLASRSYHVDKKHRTVHWVREGTEEWLKEELPDHRVSGFVVRAMREIASQQDLFMEALVSGELPQGSPAELREALDLATVEALRAIGAAWAAGPDEIIGFMDFITK